MEESFDNPNEVELAPEEGAEEIKETPEEKAETDGGFQVPEKFKNKTREEIARSYTELEKMRQKDLATLEEKAKQKAEEIAGLEQSGKKKEVVEAKGDLAQIEEDIDKAIDGADYENMDPKSYAKFLVKNIRKMAEAVAADRYSTEQNLRSRIKDEIRDVTKLFPILADETKPEFRELVLDIIGASKAKGKDISLEEATEKAAKAMGITKGEPAAPEVPEETKKEVKKPKAIEKSQPTAIEGDNESEEDAVKKGIMGAGYNGSLGGL